MLDVLRKMYNNKFTHRHALFNIVFLLILYFSSTAMGDATSEQIEH